MRSTLYFPISLFICGCLTARGQFHAIAASSAVPACEIASTDGTNTVKISLPDATVKTVSEWSMEGVPVRGEARSVILTFESWRSGPYEIQALNHQKTLCALSIARDAVAVSLSEYTDPYVGTWEAGSDLARSAEEAERRAAAEKVTRTAAAQAAQAAQAAALQVQVNEAQQEVQEAISLAKDLNRLANEQAVHTKKHASAQANKRTAEMAKKAQEASTPVGVAQNRLAQLTARLDDLKVDTEARDVASNAMASRAGSTQMEIAQQAAVKAEEAAQGLLATNVKVYFATERQMIPGGTLAFANWRDPSHQILFGVASVTVPADARPLLFPGSGLYRFFASQAAPPRTLNIGVNVVGDGEFYQQIRNQLAATAHPAEVLVYIHGFNNGFQEEIWRAAKLSRDIGLVGAPVVYDWPSWDGGLTYIADLRAMEASVESLADFLTQIQARTGASQIDIIAHSMGNYGLLNALERLRLQGLLPQINNIIMAAPDVTPDQATQLIPRLLATGKISAMTLYASSMDFAMRVSNHYNKVLPIGGLPPVTRFPRLVTVDASAVALEGFGHDYFVSSRAVEEDIGYVLRNHAVPRQLGQVISAGQTYWRIVPE